MSEQGNSDIGTIYLAKAIRFAAIALVIVGAMACGVVVYLVRPAAPQEQSRVTRSESLRDIVGGDRVAWAACCLQFGYCVIEDEHAQYPHLREVSQVATLWRKVPRYRALAQNQALEDAIADKINKVAEGKLTTKIREDIAEELEEAAIELAPKIKEPKDE